MVKKVIIVALLSVALFCSCTIKSENNLEKTQNLLQEASATLNPSDSSPKSVINDNPTQSEANNNPNPETSSQETSTPNVEGNKALTVNNYIKNYEEIFYYYGDELYDFPGSAEIGCRKVFKVYNIDSGTFEDIEINNQEHKIGKYTTFEIQYVQLSERIFLLSSSYSAPGRGTLIFSCYSEEEVIKEIKNNKYYFNVYGLLYVFDLLKNEITEVISAPMENDPFTLYNDFYFSYEEEGDGSLIWASLCIANQDESEIIFYTNRSSLIPEYEGTDFYYVRNLRTGEEIGLDKMLGAYKQDKMLQFIDNEIIFEHNGKLVALNIRNGQERTYIPEESNSNIKCTRNPNITQSGYIFDIADIGSWIKPDNDANIESRITYEDIKIVGQEKYYDIGHNNGQQEVKDIMQLKSNGWSTSPFNAWTMLHEYSQFTYTTPNSQQTIWYKEMKKGIQIVDYVIQSDDMYYRLDSGHVDPILCYNPSDESIIHYPIIRKYEIKKKLDELAKCVLFVKPYCITIDDQYNLNVINFVEDKVKTLSFNALGPKNLEGDLHGEKVLFISQPNRKSFYRSLYVLDLANMNYKILTPPLNILIENAFWTKDGKVYIEFRQIDWNTQIEVL